MAKYSSEGGKYPPTEFSQKYTSVMAPNEKLVSPKDIFGESGVFDKDVEEKTRQAFRLTMKKLDKLNTPTAKCKEDLEREKMDQIVECFPHTMPKELPLLLPKIKWTKTAQEVDTWEVWWEMHEKILKLLKKQAKHIHNWWEFTGKPDPGIDAIVDCLKRLVTSVLTHPVTIGRMVALHTKKRKKNHPKSVHLVGTDRPEATMIYAGFFHEILAANSAHPIKLTLVSPDQANATLAKDCGPSSPMLIDQRCKLTAWSGLYHDFWDSYIETQQVEKPDIVLGIHPGLHADGVYEFWEPTLDLLLDHNITTVFTVLDRKEYSQSLKQLDRLFCKYLFKGKNAFGSKHVKQTPHDPDLMWSSNQYIIVFKGRTVDLKTLTLIEPSPADALGNDDEDLDQAEEDFERLLRESGE